MTGIWTVFLSLHFFNSYYIINGNEHAFTMTPVVVG